MNRITHIRILYKKINLFMKYNIKLKEKIDLWILYLNSLKMNRDLTLS